MNSDRIYYSNDGKMRAVREMALVTLLCLMFGLGIGAVLALLFAPSSGRKVRDDLANTIEEGVNDGRDAIEPLVKRLEKEFDELRQSVEDRLKQS